MAASRRDRADIQCSNGPPRRTSGSEPPLGIDSPWLLPGNVQPRPRSNLAEPCLKSPRIVQRDDATSRRSWIRVGA